MNPYATRACHAYRDYSGIHVWTGHPGPSPCLYDPSHHDHAGARSRSGRPPRACCHPPASPPVSGRCPPRQSWSSTSRYSSYRTIRRRLAPTSVVSSTVRSDCPALHDVGTDVGEPDCRTRCPGAPSTANFTGMAAASFGPVDRRQIVHRPEEAFERQAARRRRGYSSGQDRNGHGLDAHGCSCWCPG